MARMLLALGLAAVVAAGAEPAAKSPAPAPQVTARAKEGGITEITITPPGGGPALVYQVDLSKHIAPPPERSGAIAAWESLRFGAFLCFNTNQFSGHELCKAADPKLYSPPELDVAGWIAAFRRAGMRYAVLTVRHTSGFLLWDSPTTDFDVAASGNKTDVVKAYVEACRQHGLAPGLYYCMWGGKDWMPHPHARALILAQLHELATRYGDIPYFWIDMQCWAPADLPAQEVYDALKSAQPNTVVIFNQHVQDGRQIRYFPTDVLDGEITLPPPEGHKPLRQAGGQSYYLPFEFSPVSQAHGGRGQSVAATPMGPGCWFTYGTGRGWPPSRPFDADKLFEWIKTAYERGAACVLLATAPDHTGRLRAEDAEQLTRLGEKLSKAGLLRGP